MLRAAISIGLGAALLAAAVLGVDGAASAPIASRIVDRTFGCIPAAVTGNLRGVEVTAVPIGAKENHDPTHQNRSPGFIGAGSGGWGLGSELVSVRARGWQRFTTSYSHAGVYASIARCARSRLSVTLSANGLSNGPVRWFEEVTCLGRGRVLIRVRALMQTPALWQPLIRFAYDGARDRVVEAALAIRSERTGRPIAYMELARDGTTKLWYSPACVA
ncbi:MAG: hypothetical protein ABIR67_11330 [Gaiellaceae bacterium]